MLFCCERKGAYGCGLWDCEYEGVCSGVGGGGWGGGGGEREGGGVREIAFGGRELARSSCEIRLNLVAEREGERGKEKESGGESK